MHAKHLTAAALLALSGAAVAQPPTVTYDLSFRVIPNWANPFHFVSIGEQAQFSLNVSISPPIGTAITYASPSGPAVGTIAGLGSIWFDLDACDAAPGQWTLSGQGFQGTTGTTWGVRAGWTLGASPGTPQPDGSLDNITAGQFLFPGATANATNPIVEIWRGKWTPQLQPGRLTRFITRSIETTVYLHTGTLKTGEAMYTAVPAKTVQGSAHFIHDPGSPWPCFPGFPSVFPSQTVAAGRAAQFNIADLWSQGTCQWGYQWLRNCAPLVNGGNITGANSPTLRIDPVSPADAGIYDVWVGGMRSSHARLSVLCYPNCDGSTSYPALNANDFQCFLDQFAAGAHYANCDSVGGLTANDFQCFLDRYAAGCT